MLLTIDKLLTTCRFGRCERKNIDRLTAIRLGPVLQEMDLEKSKPENKV